MSETGMQTIADTSGKSRKPRIALMGEFSAGKSTLSNLLLGARPLPEKVTATRLSPVWIAHGTDPAYRETVDGELYEVSLSNIGQIPVEETRVIRLFLEADILEVCDLIDFPGISDPNMSADVWQRMLSEVDAVLWCTHATQAWRQSEAGVWETMPANVRARSALLITRWDKLLTDRDRNRVLGRVKRETEGMFEAIFPISLTQALAAGEDEAKWAASGANAFADHLIDLVMRLTEVVSRSMAPLYTAEPPESRLPPQQTRRIQPLKQSKPGALKAVREEDIVTPRRVRATGERTARPRRDAVDTAGALKIGAEAQPDPDRTTRPAAELSGLRSTFAETKPDDDAEAASRER